MVGQRSVSKPKSPETVYLAYPVMPFADRSDRYPKKLFTWTFCLVITLAIIMGMLFIWGWCFKIEESVPGFGQIVPLDKIRRVMSPVAGKIKAIYVHEDQFVHAGDLLVELDP